MKKLFVIGSLLLVIFTQTAIAVDSTPSADIKAKLEELKKEIASKAAKIKLEVDRKLQNKAYSGKIKSISNQSITISTQSGPKIISINQDTVYESKIKNKTKLSFKNLAEEDNITGLGDVDETGVLLAKKIVLLKPINLKAKTYLWGQVISISDELTTIKDKDLKYVSATLPEKPAAKVNDFVILSGTKKGASSSSSINQVFEADFAFVLPQGAVLKPKKVATPSAQPASPSTKPRLKK